MGTAVQVQVRLKSGREVRLHMTHSTLALLHRCVEEQEDKSIWSGGFRAVEVESIEEVQHGTRKTRKAHW